MDGQTPGGTKSRTLCLSALIILLRSIGVEQGTVEKEQGPEKDRETEFLGQYIKDNKISAAWRANRDRKNALEVAAMMQEPAIKTRVEGLLLRMKELLKEERTVDSFS